MKKSFLLYPIITAVAAMLIGFFYVRNTMTQHNLGFRYSLKPTVAEVIQIQDISELKVLTYNVRGLPTAFDPWCDNLASIGRLLKRMRDQGRAPHVVAIQEGFHEKIHDLISLSGYPYVEQGPTGSSNEVSSGLWILSEFPLETKSEMLYKDCATWDCFANKGIQHVTVSVPGIDVPVEVYNTHMNARTNIKHLDWWVDEQRVTSVKQKQVEHFHAHYKKTHQKSSPSIVLGDFNLRFTDWLFDYLKKPFTHMLSVVGVDHHFLVQGDKLGLRPGRWQRIFKKKAYSDHDGIQLDYGLMPRRVL